MPRKTENTSFDCIICGAHVAAIAKGTIRNHCPFCLHSVHVDVQPGDRAADCHGIMRPAMVISHSKKGWQIVHKCDNCGHEQPNKLAEDDDFDEVAKIARSQ